MAEYMETEYIKKPILKIAVKSYFKHLINKGKYKIDVNDANADINRIISELPAADVAEEKHGKWIEKETYLDIYYDCSICGESFCFLEGSPTDNSYKYFPNCGAKMDGERKTE